MATVWIVIAPDGRERRIDVCNACLDAIERSHADREAIEAAFARDHEGESEDRYSLGIYAGHYCDRHWAESGYRDEPAGAFDPDDAGETY